MKRRALPVLLTLAVAGWCLLISGRAAFSLRMSSQKAGPAHAQSTPAPNARIDINTASIEELLRAPGMTRTWAARIIRFRPYRAKNELLDKGIVSTQVYERISGYIIAHRPK